jgi:hypothetical protein
LFKVSLKVQATPGTLHVSAPKGDAAKTLEMLRTIYSAGIYNTGPMGPKSPHARPSSSGLVFGYRSLRSSDLKVERPRLEGWPIAT